MLLCWNYETFLFFSCAHDNKNSLYFVLVLASMSRLWIPI